MNDLTKEALLTLNEARSAFPGGKRLGLATIQRWRMRGVRGVKLETLLVGGMRYTSREAIARFIAAQNAADAPAVPVITPTQRRRQSEAAASELKKMGVR